MAPEGFWSVQVMRDALASWHLGRVIAAYRNHPFHGRPLPQETVGAWVGMTQPQISRLENGPPTKDLDKLVFWARTLCIPGRLLWFKLPEDQEPAAVGHDGSSASSPEGGVADSDAGVADLLAGFTAASMPLLAPTAGDLAGGVGAVAGMSLAQSAELLLRFFIHMDDEMGGDALYRPLSRYVTRLAVDAQSQPGDGLFAFGQLSQMTGWLALDANRHADARRFLTTAVYVAHEVNEPALAASALAYMSLQETYRGQRRAALALAETAITTGRGHVTPLVTTTVGTRLARAHARLGNERACRDALEHAHVAFETPGDVEEPLWVSYVDEIEVLAQEGACYLDLGMSAEAITSLQAAIGLLKRQAPHRVRDRVHYLSRLAKSHLADSNLEQACDVGDKALSLSQAIGSARVIERLGEFDEALTPFETTAPGREFRERFALATT